MSASAEREKPTEKEDALRELNSVSDVVTPPHHRLGEELHSGEFRGKKCDLSVP